ncbi:MAG: hypothetical protein HP496_03085 [Nitrospira sp.]|nr:hypothetical protein [Nitrospira sp.]
MFGAVVLAVGCISVPAFAGSPTLFSASGTISKIDVGDVDPAGKSGRFIVRDRHIEGTFAGDISGGFTITYDANVPLATQSGPVYARMTVGVYEANMTIVSSLGPTPVPCGISDGVTCIETPVGNFVPGLLLNGRMNFLSGAQGTGNVNAWLIPILDEQGHIISIAASLLMIAGQWSQ